MERNIGYGVCSFKSGAYSAHSISYMVFNNLPEVKEDVVRHRCPYKGCVNPAHLIEGSYVDNAIDMIEDVEHLR